MKLVHALLVMAVISALENVTSTAQNTTAATPKPTIPGPHGLNLNGKMFTLSLNRGGISFYPPSWPSTLSSTTSPYYTNTPPYTRQHPYTTTQHYPTTSKHHYTTTKHPYTRYPYTTTKQPYTSTKHYPTTSRHHYTTTKRPYTTTKRPYTTTKHHYTTTKRPYTTTKRPYTTTKHPYTTTKRPYTTSKRPYTTTKRPYTTTKHPYTTTKSPYTTTKSPFTTTQPPYTTTKRPYIPTTAPSARGVSVCLRYLDDFAQTSYLRTSYSIFTLSPTSNPLQVDVDHVGGYTLNFNSYRNSKLKLKPSIRFWSNIGPDIWSRVCLTVDSMKNVAQVFSGSNISIRKVIPDQYDQYVWSGEPVIEFPGFDGQVTDVQMWDYPLSYREVFKYMTSGVHGPYRGSVLTWSSISYTPSGNTLLEDVYEWQTKQKIIGRRRGRQPKGGRKNRKFVNEEEREEGIRDQL